MDLDRLDPRATSARGRPRQRAARVPRPARRDGRPAGRGVRTTPAQRLPLRQRRARQRGPGALGHRRHRGAPDSADRGGSSSRRPRGARPGRTVPGAVSAGVGITHLQEIRSPSQRYSGQVFLRELAVCICGEDLRPGLPRTKPSAAVAAGFMPTPIPCSHGRGGRWPPRPTPRGSVALALKWSGGETLLMRTAHQSRPPIPPQSAFAGFRFPPDVIVLAVRW